MQSNKRQILCGLLVATRPKTLWAAVCPVAIATAWAFQEGQANGFTAIVCLAGAILLQIGANYSNDYFDFIKGTDTAARLGPIRATQAGLVSPATMRRTFILVFALAGICAAILAWHSSWIILVIYGLSVLGAILYTAGPLPLGYIGLGDLLAFLFFGPIATAGTYYVQTHNWDLHLVIAGLAPGFFSMAMIDVNNLRDIDTDRRAGKRTPAVLFGRGFARWEYTLSLIAAAAIPIWLWQQDAAGPAILASLVFILPAAWVLPMVFLRTDGRSLNRALAMTGVLLLLYSILFVVGLIQ